MLSSRLTLDDEDAVQAELKELQTEAVSRTALPCLIAVLMANLCMSAPRGRTTAHHFPICSNDRA